MQQLFTLSSYISWAYTVTYRHSPATLSVCQHATLSNPFITKLIALIKSSSGDPNFQEFKIQLSLFTKK